MWKKGSPDYGCVLNLKASKASSVWAGVVEPALGSEEGGYELKLGEWETC